MKPEKPAAISLPRGMFDFRGKSPTRSAPDPLELDFQDAARIHLFQKDEAHPFPGNIPDHGLETFYFRTGDDQADTGALFAKMPPVTAKICGRSRNSFFRIGTVSVAGGLMEFPSFNGKFKIRERKSQSNIGPQIGPVKNLSWAYGPCQSQDSHQTGLTKNSP